MKTKPNTQLKASQGLTLSVAAFLAATSIAFAQDAPTAAPAEEPPAATPVAEVPAAAPPPPAAPVVVAQPPAAKPEGVAVLSLGGTKISLYGFLQLNGVYESGANGGLIWSNYAPQDAEDGEGRFLINVNQTRIGFNLAGPQKENGAEISGRFESDFVNNANRNNNGNPSFRIRQAFGQLRFNDIGLSLLFGQTSDVIAPLVAPSLNQGALQGQGSLGTRRPMIRLAQVLGPTEISVAATDNRDASSPVLPAFQGSIKAKTVATWAGEKQNVELILSGHYASAEVAAETEAEKDAKDADGWKAPPPSWSGVVSLSLPIINAINLSGEVFYGQNLSSYNVGSIGQAWSAAPDANGKGLQSLGGWGALNIKLPEGFALAGGLGLEALDKDREPVKGRNKNTVIFGNLKYNVAETAFIGVEYVNLSTDYVDSSSGERETGSGKLNRVELVFNYAFK
jgi:hypothetical protein